jgi:hypothetical protein
LSTIDDNSRLQFAVARCYDSAADALGDLICGIFWWWSMLIPAFAVIGEGVGKYLRWREEQRKQASPNLSANHPVAYQSSAHSPVLSAPATSELVKPSSVTEHTTKHLE